MDLSKYDLIIRRHAFDQALRRGIHPDLIEQTLLKGKLKRFGKHGVKFINKGKKRMIICVGELIGNKIKVITIEEVK